MLLHPTARTATRCLAASQGSPKPGRNSGPNFELSRAPPQLPAARRRKHHGESSGWHLDLPPLVPLIVHLGEERVFSRQILPSTLGG